MYARLHPSIIIIINNEPPPFLKKKPNPFRLFIYAFEFQTTETVAPPEET